MDSKSYWKNREEENLRSNLKEEEEYVKEINRIYDRMMVQITKEINDFYVRYAKKEGISISEARKRVKKLDINAYAEKAKKYVKEKDFSDEANEEMRLYNLTMKVNRLELLKAQIGLELVDNFNDLQKYFDEKLTKRTMDEFKRQAGILGKTLQDNEKAAHAVVNASFHNATFSDRIWLYQGLLKNDLYKLLQTGIIQGKNPRVLAADLVKKFNVSRYNAERLMRTELARVQTEAQKQSFERNEFELYTFIANADCCPICARLDGKHFKVKDMLPGENAAPMHPNCRCSTAAYEDSATYEAWLDYLNNGGTTEEWNSSGKAIWKSKNRHNKKLKYIEKSGKSDTIYTGARIIDPESEEGIAFAKMYYAEIRSFSTDSEKIANNIGKAKDDIDKIKKYLFFTDSFTPDCAISHSWQRLMNGKDIKEHDLILIEHEIYEMQIKKDNPGISHSEAHEMATLKYNYQKASDKYYGNLNKNKKRK